MLEIIDDAPGTYNTNSQIKFKTSTLKSSLYDYSHAIYLWVSGTKTAVEVAAGEGNNNIQVVCKNCFPFTDWISKINNTKIDTAKDIDVLMPIFNLLEYPVNHSKIRKFMAIL